MNPLRIGIVIGTEFSHGRAIWQGITEYIQRHQLKWVIYGVRYHTSHAHVLTYCKRANLDGLIYHVASKPLLTWAAKCKIPMVSTSASHERWGYNIILDDAAIGQAAADFMVQKGFESFGYVGMSRAKFCGTRFSGYRDKLLDLGFRCRRYIPKHTAKSHEPWDDLDNGFIDWLRAQSKPFGLFCTNDEVAGNVLNICRSHDIKVPQDVALLGVDNDEDLCLMQEPGLSSIAVPSVSMGYQAAEALAKGLRGQEQSGEVVHLPPLDVVERQSTDFFRTDDPLLSQSLDFIRMHYHTGINVSDVVSQTPVCRSILERKFRHGFNMSILEMIKHTRLQRAVELLTGSDLDFATVAQSVGLKDAKYLHAFLRRETGKGPKEWRGTTSPLGQL